MHSSTQQLHSIFQQQIAGAKQLLDALKMENEALVQRDFDVIQNSTSLKTGLTQALEKLGKQQREFLLSNGQTDSADGMESYIALQTSPAANILKQQKSELQPILEQCQTMNQVNGNIIAASKQSAETALAILRGQLSPENLVYSAGGQPVSDHSTSTLTRA